MSKLNGKELSYAVMHGTVHVPEVGQIGKTLSATATAEYRAVKMTVDEPYVIVEAAVKGKKSVSINIPIVNFSHMVVKEDLAKDNKT